MKTLGVARSTRRRLVCCTVMLALALAAFGSAAVVGQDYHGNLGIGNVPVAYAECDGTNPQPDTDCPPTPTATPTPDPNG